MLGVSSMVFMAIWAGVNSFQNTVTVDTAAVAQQEISAYVCGVIIEAVGDGDHTVSMELDIPEFINGEPYLVYPSIDGRSIRITCNILHRQMDVLYPLNLRVAGIRIS